MLQNRIISLAIAVLVATVEAASPLGSRSPNTGRRSIIKPDIKAYPHNSCKSYPTVPRTKECFVEAKGDGGDDADAILSALQECNQGGKVVLDANYTIGTVLDLTFLESIDIALSGSIKFTDDIDYWVDNEFQYDFQNSTSFLKIGGTDVNIYGDGVGLIDGSGQAWWEAFNANASLLRPILFVTDGLHGGSITGINMINSPNVIKLHITCPKVSVRD
jgi:galacturan 1,4-alpha-galacturonidase